MCTLCQLRPLPGPPDRSAVPGLLDALRAGRDVLVAGPAFAVRPEAVAGTLVAGGRDDRVRWWRLDLAGCARGRVSELVDDARAGIVDGVTVVECAGPARRRRAVLRRLLRPGRGPGRLVVIVHGRVRRRRGLVRCPPDGAPADARRHRPPPRRAVDEALAAMTPADRHAVDHACRLGYWHPSIDGGADPTRLAPFAVALTDGWYQIRPAWRATLVSRLGQVRPTARASAPSGLGTDAAVDDGGPPPAVAVVPTTGAPLDPPPRPPAAPPAEPATLHVDVRLFGRFEVAVDGRPVERWRGVLPWSMLAYVVSRPGASCSRDALGQLFWPDVDHAQLRNRLHVAVSSVRRSLRAAGGVGVLEYADGRYRIDPDVDLTVDAVEFDTAVAAGRRAETAGDSDGALAAYRHAARLHRDLFLVDAPYEEWTHVPRESYRLTYLEVLERLAELALARHDLDELVLVAQRMLELDACNEAAHRLLIRAHLGLGRTNEALRQYEQCRRVLRANLALHPAAATVALYREIRERSDETA